MKLSLFPVPVLALALTTLCGVGCAAPTDGEAASTESSASALTILPGPVLALDAMSLCSGTTPDQSLAWTNTKLEIFAGYSNPNRTCDFSVFELTGAQNHGLTMSISDLVPVYNGSTANSAFPLEHPYTDVTQSECAASYVDYEAFGWVPPHGSIGPTGRPIWYPGYWKAIGTENVVSGTWGTGPGDSTPHCTFGSVEATTWYTADRILDGTQTYDTIRVAAKAVLSTPTGLQRGNLIVFAAGH
jgi:hypothetical protein